MSRVICDTPEPNDSLNMRYLYARLEQTTNREQVLIIHKMIKQWSDKENEPPGNLQAISQTDEAIGAYNNANE